MQNVLKDEEGIVILAHYIQEVSNNCPTIKEENTDVLTYKKVANCVKPVAMTLPEEFRII